MSNTRPVKNIPLTDYLSRHPIIPSEIAELENKADGLTEAEAEEEFVINQIYGLLEFNQKRGSIKRFTERNETTRHKNSTNHNATLTHANEIKILIRSKPHRYQAAAFQTRSKFYRRQAIKWTRSTELIWILYLKREAIHQKRSVYGSKETIS